MVLGGIELQACSASGQLQDCRSGYKWRRMEVEAITEDKENVCQKPTKQDSAAE